MIDPIIRRLIISCPHSSAFVPEGIFRHMVGAGIDRSALEKRLFLQGDPFTQRIFALDGAEALLDASVSRFVVDLNRAREEEGENGVIKITDFALTRLYARGDEPDAAESERRKRLYYDPFHAELKRLMSGGEGMFLLDGHSMEAAGPALGPDPGKPRPGICLGNFGDARGERMDGKGPSCPPALARALAQAIEEELAPLWKDAAIRSRLSEPVLLNDPFDGGFVLEAHGYGPGRAGIMIEVNRALYLDEAVAEPLPGRVELLREGFSRVFSRFVA